MTHRQLALTFAVCLQSVAPAAVAQTLPPAMHAEVAARSPESVAASPADPSQPARRADPSPPEPAPAATPDAAPALRTFRGHPEDDLLREMATRPVLRVIERFNSSTLVFHCDLGDGIEMAFKPARQGEHDWWIHEVAGYELARRHFRAEALNRVVLVSDGIANVGVTDERLIANESHRAEGEELYLVGVGVGLPQLAAGHRGEGSGRRGPQAGAGVAPPLPRVLVRRLSVARFVCSPRLITVGEVIESVDELVEPPGEPFSLGRGSDCAREELVEPRVPGP